MLSTAKNGGKVEKKELYTKLSTLSTKKDWGKLVYIVCFSEYMFCEEDIKLNIKKKTLAILKVKKKGKTTVRCQTNQQIVCLEM